MTMTRIQLSDDGTLDTVLCCADCGEEFRFNFDGMGPDGIIEDETEAQAAYDAFVEGSIAEITDEHECGAHEYEGRSGDVRILLNYDDRDDTYDGKVCVGDHAYSISVHARVYKGGNAVDSTEAFNSAAHACLSFAADDKEWGQGDDIFTPAAEMTDSGWKITRVR
jgi:hypothetical protein